MENVVCSFPRQVVGDALEEIKMAFISLPMQKIKKVRNCQT